MKQELQTLGVLNETGATKRSVGGEAIFAVTGVFGGASVAVQVSVDGSVWTSVNDRTDTVIAITAATGDAYRETIKSEMSVRSVITGGDGTTALVITMMQ
jgi:streptogramin lyase